MEPQQRPRRAVKPSERFANEQAKRIIADIREANKRKQDRIAEKKQKMAKLKKNNRKKYLSQKRAEKSALRKRLTSSQRKLLKSVPIVIFNPQEGIINPKISISLLGVTDAEATFIFTDTRLLSVQIQGFFKDSFNNSGLSFIGFDSVDAQRFVNMGNDSFKPFKKGKTDAPIPPNALLSNFLFYIRTVPGVGDLSEPMKNIIKTQPPMTNQLVRLFYLFMFKNIGDSSTIAECKFINENNYKVIKPPTRELAEKISDTFLSGISQTPGKPLDFSSNRNRENIKTLNKEIREEIRSSDVHRRNFFIFDKVAVVTPDRMAVIECILRGQPFMYRNTAGKCIIVTTTSDCKELLSEIQKVSSMFLEGIQDIFNTSISNPDLALYKRQLLDGAHDFGDGGKQRARSRSSINLQEYLRGMNKLLDALQTKLGANYDLLKTFLNKRVVNYDNEQNQIVPALEILAAKYPKLINIIQVNPTNRATGEQDIFIHFNPPGTLELTGFLQDAAIFVNKYFKLLKLKGMSRLIDSSTELIPSMQNIEENIILTEEEGFSKFFKQIQVN